MPHSDDNSSDGGGDSDSTVDARPPPRKKARSPTPEPINIELALQQIHKLTEEMRLNKKKRGIRGDLNWRQVIPALKEEAASNGFPKSVLKELWYIISTVGPHIKMPQRTELVYLMIPQTLISAKFIEQILEWFVANVNKVLKSLFIPFLKYFLGLVEYSLIKGECFRKAFTYTTLLALSENTELTEWLFRLLKKVTTKELIQRFHVLTISSLWKRSLAPSQKKAVVDLLKLYKALRPDYLPHNVFNINILIKTTTPKAKLHEYFLKCLFEAKRRASGAASQAEANAIGQNNDDSTDDSSCRQMDIYDARQLISTNFFPELGPYFDDQFTLQMMISDTKLQDSIPRYKKMLWSLTNTDTVPMILIDRELLECFQTWLSIHFDHKFCHYDARQNGRYEFVLQRCIQVTTLLGDGLSVVDDWLPNFLLNWDTHLFRSQVLALFSYLNTFSDDDNLIFKKFEYDFLFSSQSRSYEVWDMFDKLLTRWLKLFSRMQQEDTFPEDQAPIALSVENLFLFMNSLVTKYMDIHFQSENAESMAILMSRTFIKLRKMFEKHKIVIPTAKNQKPLKVRTPKALVSVLNKFDSNLYT